MKPECVVDFLGECGNIFFIEFQVVMTLAELGEKDVKKIPQEVKDNAKDYYDAIRIMGKYVEFIPTDAVMYDKYMEQRDENEVDGTIISNILKERLNEIRNC